LPLQQAAIAKRAQVVFVGDYQQLVPVGAGNTYSNLVQSGKINTCYLSDIIRQRRNQQLLQAVREAVRGDINKSLALVADSTQEICFAAKRFKAIADEYTGLSPADQANTIILTAKNKDRIALNEAIRARLIKTGQLAQGTEIIVQPGNAPETKRCFAQGDKILFFKNNYRLGVMNGQNGMIKAVEGQKITVETAGKTLVIDAGEYRHFDHGYVMTTHKAQGVTEDRVIINMDSAQRSNNSRNSYYVDISRARHTVSIYVDDQNKINRQISQFIEKISSRDFTQETALIEKQKSTTGIKRPVSSAEMLTKAIEIRRTKIVDMMEDAIKGVHQSFKRKMGMHK
jgi:ATP-dependent exoDNAse (exonuclease V), alpha subunit - helicase superfamily I member